VTSPIRFTADAEADALLSCSPLALVIGMLLDQQVPMEWAFAAPSKLRDRLGGALDAAVIAARDPMELEAIFRGPPALHRYPAAMAKRVQRLCAVLVEEYDGRAEAVWEAAPDGATLVRRLEGLPGYGEQKARIFTALLAKRLDVKPAGWREAAGDYGLEGHRSIADVDGPEALLRVRQAKAQKKKAAARAARED
jgi:uncharacterized HhH-GPD family protein